MNKMTRVTPPTARTVREMRTEMLLANRFLGVHQVWWGVFLTPLALYLLDVVTAGDWRWWWPLPAFLLAWAGVELCFLPRRLVIYRLARIESQAEVVRLAWQHGVALRDVKRRHSHFDAKCRTAPGQSRPPISPR